MNGMESNWLCFAESCLCFELRFSGFGFPAAGRRLALFFQMEPQMDADERGFLFLRRAFWLIFEGFCEFM